MRWAILAGAAGAILLAACGQRAAVAAAQPTFAKGLPTDPGYFPIGVWLQAPHNAARFRELGINLYIGLWQGPTQAHLSELEAAGMPVICSQNEVGLAYQGDIIVGWMHGDEPDNAQAVYDEQGNRTGWGPCVPPQEIVDDYHRLKARDATRPILLNLGQGVANDEWHGRGAGAQLSDYETYVLGADLVSFDVYPVAGIGKPDGEEYLWYVAKGVERLRGWAPATTPVWAVLECTHISSPRKATPEQVRSMAWMAICRGATGLLYFVHQFEPNFIEAALLVDDEMCAGITALNGEITALAPVINAPTVPDGVTVESEAPIAALVKQHDGATYLLTVSLRNEATEATFRLPGGDGTVEVLGEQRTLPLAGGVYRDSYEPYAVHHYRIR